MKRTEYAAILVCKHPSDFDYGSHNGYIRVPGAFDSFDTAWNAGVMYSREHWLSPRVTKTPGKVGGEGCHDVTVLSREVLPWEIVYDERPEYIGRRVRMSGRGY